MAKLVVVAVFDGAVGAHVRPMFLQSKGQAIRSFSDEVKRPDTKEAPSPMHVHPSDYELRYLGTWDEESGVFNAVDGVQVLVRAQDVAQ